jgi:formylglycine-generating enzyme
VLYDHRQGRFTPERFLAQAERDFGGFDGVLLWHAYPVVGIDARRKFDFYRGIPELPEVTRAFQARGLRVFVSYYPWATGPDAQSEQEVADLVGWLGADGVFLDTVKEGSAALRDALDGLGADILMGGESRVPLARVHDHQLSWAQWFADSAVPGVLRAIWLERWHVLHHTRRWHRSHLDELHSAWLNGCGVLV